jgi:hypothetical protein
MAVLYQYQRQAWRLNMAQAGRKQTALFCWQCSGMREDKAPEWVVSLLCVSSSLQCAIGGGAHRVG